MEQLLASALGEVADGALGDAILEVGIDATEGELLSCVVAGLLEGVVVEAPVVAVVVLDPHACLAVKVLKARLAARVSAHESLTWRWTKCRWLQWSTKIVVHL
jgi:hypothetical protein